MPMSEPTMGRFEGKTHILPVRVYYEDTDVSGIVYHANYLRFLERGRSEALRLAGVHHMVMMSGEEPVAWTIRRIELDYARPAKLDDALEVHTRYRVLAGARLNGEQWVKRNGEDLVTAKIEAALITMTGRPRRIPEDVRAKIAQYLD
jgi:acyl-CoA thioester hydrolase